MLIHRANGGHTVVVGEFIKVGVVSIQMSIAAGKCIECALAVMAVRGPLIHRQFPERAGQVQPGATPGSPTVVGHRGYVPVPGHGIHQVGVRGVCEIVVSVDSCPWSHAAGSYTVVPGRYNTGHISAVMFQRMIYAAAGVVVISGCVNVVSQVFMGEVQTIVNHGDVYAFSLESIRPDGFDVDVLTITIVQVPLASVQGVASLRATQ